MRKVIVLFLLIILAVGCVPVLIGAGAVGGYTLSNDSASGKINVDYHTLWETVKSVLADNKLSLIVSDESKGLIKAEDGELKITVRINSINENQQRLVVAVRKYLLPKPHKAQEIFFAVAKKLE